MNDENPTPALPPKHSSFGAWRRPVILVLAVTVLAVSSPFLYMDGINKDSFWLTSLGQLGIAVCIVVLFVLPFLPKRFGFRLYDFLAILIALVFAATQAPNLVREQPQEQEKNQINISEKDALQLAEQLEEHASAKGTEALAAFFIEQLESKGEITVEIRQEETEGTIYQASAGKYLFKLVILPPENAGETGFTFTALSAPNVDMKSFFIDKDGKTIPLNIKMPL